MAEVFLLALIMLFIKELPGMGAQLHYGIYVFSASVILSLVISILMPKKDLQPTERTSKEEATEPEAGEEGAEPEDATEEEDIEPEAEENAEEKASGPEDG